MRLLSAVLLVQVSTCLAYDFPSFPGKIHNLTGLALGPMEISVRYECSGEKGDKCGDKTVTAKVDSTDQSFTIPAVSIGPAPGQVDFFKEGWGKRYDVTVNVVVKDHAEYFVAHDLRNWGWEASRDGHVRKMQEELKRDFADLTMLAVRETSFLSIANPKNLIGREVRLRMIKRFPSEQNTPDIAMTWLRVTVNESARDEKEIQVGLPPMFVVLRGKPARYGENPRTRSIAYLYVGDKKKIEYQGYTDETGTFSSKSFFAAEDARIIFAPFPEK